MNQRFILSMMFTLVAVTGCAGQPKPDGSVKESAASEKLEADGSQKVDHAPSEDTSLGCPRPVILRDLSRQIIVADDTQPFDPSQVIARIQLERVAHANCEVSGQKGRASLEGVVRLSAIKGPYFPKDNKSLEAAYFIVARKPNGDIVGKVEKKTALKFESESDTYVGKIDTVELKQIAIRSDEEFDELEFFVGLQFSPESWNFHQTFQSQLFGTKH